MNIMKKRISLILSIIMLALVIIPIVNVNATSTESQVSMTAKMGSTTLKDNTRYKVEGGERVVVNASTSAKGEDIAFIAYYFYPIQTWENRTKIYSNKATIVIPEQEPGTLLNLLVEPVATNDDASENTVTKTGWHKYTLEYVKKSDDNNDVVTGKDIKVTYGSKTLSNGGTTTVKAGDKVVVNATPSDKVSKIWYSFDDEGRKSVSSSTYTLTIPSDAKAGTYKFIVNAVYDDGLYVDGKDANNTKSEVYYFKVEEETTNNDTITGKDIKVTYGSKTLSNGGTTTVKAGDKVEVKVTPSDKVSKIWYSFDDEGRKSVSSSTYTLTIPSDAKAGTYKFIVNAVYDDGLYVDGKDENNTKSEVYYFKVEEETTNNDTITGKDIKVTYGSKTLSNGGTTTVKAGDKVVVNATPSDKVSKIWYSFDDEGRKSVSSSTYTLTIPSDAKAGTYKFIVNAVYTDGLYVDGKDANNTTSEIYYLKINETVVDEPVVDDNRDLDIEPWMEENDETEELSISLRNDSEEEDKANKNIYELNEVVTYYIDYKNGGKDIDEASITLELPLDFKAVSLDGGKINSDDEIEWNFENGLEEGESGTIIVKVKYTDLKKSRDDANTIYPTAAIYKGSKVKDVSTVINFIITSYDEELDIEHEPYMYGDANADTFRPDHLITRAEGALVLARIFGLDYENITTITTKYTDINDTYLEAQKAITAASEAGLINGYDEGNGTYTYRPNSKMTKAEFMKILACMIQEGAEDEGIEGLEIKDKTQLVKVYDDATRYYVVNGKRVYTHWALEEITLLARLNMLPLTEDEPDFELDQKITRAEVAQLINFYLLRAPAEETTKTGFSDVSKRHHLVGDIIEATREAHTFSITDEATEVKE